MNEESHPWSAAVGVTIVLGLVLSMALVATGGWRWFATFIESAAPAWVQAVGSVGAIGVAIWLGQRTERAAARGAMNQYVLFKAGVRDSVVGAIHAGDRGDVVELRYVRAELRDVVTLGQALRLDQLPGLDALAAIQFRAIAARAEAVLAAALDSDYLDMNVRFACTELMDLHERLDVAEGVARGAATS